MIIMVYGFYDDKKGWDGMGWDGMIRRSALLAFRLFTGKA